MVEQGATQALQIAGDEDARRTAAPKNRVHRARWDGQGQFAGDAVEVAVEVFAARFFLVKGAKIAGRGAKRDVQIDSRQGMSRAGRPDFPADAAKTGPGRGW